MAQTRSVRIALLISALLAAWMFAWPLPPVVAQSPGAKGDCSVAPPAKSPTETAKGPHSGTKNMGSTGWSGGGMGGSHNDTSDAGPLPGSKSEHPPTASGLDPLKSKDKAPPC